MRCQPPYTCCWDQWLPISFHLANCIFQAKTLLEYGLDQYYEWERKGVPFRIEIGPKDIEKGSVALARRVVPEGAQRKSFIAEDVVIAEMPTLLEDFQSELRDTAKARREENTVRGVKTIDELSEALDSGAGFVFSGWNGDPSVEDKVKGLTRATIRC